MEWLAILVAVILAFAFLQRKPSKKSRESTADEDFDDIEDEWIVTNYQWGTSHREAGWVALKGGSDVLVAGFARRGGKNLLELLRPGESVLELEREPTNPTDESAIGVYFRATGHSERALIGYIPSTLSGDIAAEFEPGLPLSPELRRTGFKQDSDAAFMVINVLVPNASDREQYIKK